MQAHGAIFSFDGIKWLVALSPHHVAFLPLSPHFQPASRPPFFSPLVLCSLKQVFSAHNDSRSQVDCPQWLKPSIYLNARPLKRLPATVLRETVCGSLPAPRRIPHRIKPSLSTFCRIPRYLRLLSALRRISAACGPSRVHVSPALSSLSTSCPQTALNSSNFGFLSVDSLVANNGGISSSSQLLPPPPSRSGADDGEHLNDPPLGPPSTKRGITRATILPEGVLGHTAPATGTPVVASHSPAADSDHSPTPPSRISTVTHFGLTEYTDTKAETGLHIAKRAIKDIHILADALRVSETRVQRLEVDVTKVVIEHRLSHVFPSDDLRSTRPRSPSITPNRSRSPTRGRSHSTTPSHSHSPRSRSRSRSPARSYHDPIDELYGRVEELEAVGRASRDDLAGRIVALEDDSSDDPVRSLDRNILDSAIKLQAGRLQTINGELRNENRALRKDLDAVQKDLTALQAQLTRLELHTPAPLRSSSHSKAPDLHFVRPRHSLPAFRSPSPTLDPRPPPPPKRRKFHESGGFLTVGPFPASKLSPTDLFVSLINGALPTFHFTDSYSVTLDPVFAYHLRVTLKAAADVQSLLKAWGTGARTVGMQEINSDGSNDPKPHIKRDSQPSASYRGDKSYRGHGSAPGRNF
ncbi:hypothetical protein B0H13DRAFT_2518859 [Mycena leptocephala]|nr:hypothetical protein B0H13DRAFT_2518859 [Mycena leptocephala]